MPECATNILIYLAICASLPGCAGAENAFSDVPILSCSGLPCVQVRLDGGPPIRLLLDFSSFASYVSTSAVENQHLGLSSRAQIGSVVLTDRFLMVDPRSGCGKLVQARHGDFVSVEIWAADSFSLNNRPVTASIDPLCPSAVVASQPIEGLIHPERRGKQLYIPGVAMSAKYHADRLFSIGSTFVTFADARSAIQRCSLATTNYLASMVILTRRPLDAPFYRSSPLRSISGTRRCGLPIPMQAP